MMIKEKDLREMRPGLKVQDGTNITLKVIQTLLTDAARERRIPVAFTTDEVKYGGLIGGSTEPCLVLYHPMHQKDYFNVCIRIKYQGTYAFISVNDFGESKLLGNMAKSAYHKEEMRSSLNSGSGLEIAGSLISAGMSRLVRGSTNKQKLEEEQMWYSIVTDIFDEVFS